MTTGMGGGDGRRDFLERMAWGFGAGWGVMTAGCGRPTAPADSPASGSGVEVGSRRKLRAAFSNAGLQSTWCALGKQTAELWGRMLDVDIDWFDGEFDPQKQRNKLDAIVHKPWDFVCVQAIQIDALAAPVRKLKERGVPVISMDTLLVPLDQMREVGVWIEVAPDQVFMGESSTRYLCEKIGGKGKVIHIGGLSAHSGAQGRRTGFENILRQFPDVEVIGGGVRWCDWKKEKARENFEALMNQTREPIAGAFFHSDDMALACVEAARKHPVHKEMVITAVDGQKEGLQAVRDGLLAATTVNPVCLIHQWSLVVGQYIVRNQEKIDELPLVLTTPGPLVAKDTGNIDAMLYLADPRHCMV